MDDPVRQYLIERQAELKRQAIDQLLAGGIQTAGGVGLIGAGGLPGAAAGVPLGMHGVGNLVSGYGNATMSGNAGRAAGAFGNTGLPGRPHTMAEILMQGGGE